jgi:hypothetical protein
MALTRLLSHSTSRQASTVSGWMYSSSEVPLSMSLALLLTSDTLSMRASLSWVSTLKVRILSISSPKKSMR